MIKYYFKKFLTIKITTNPNGFMKMGQWHTNYYVAGHDSNSRLSSGFIYKKFLRHRYNDYDPHRFLGIIFSGMYSNQNVAAECNNILGLVLNSIKNFL